MVSSGFRQVASEDLSAQVQAVSLKIHALTWLVVTATKIRASRIILVVATTASLTGVEQKTGVESWESKVGFE